MHIYQLVDFLGKDKTALWDHELNKLVKTNVDINTIDARFIRAKWMNTAFVSFVFKYARQVSHTKKAILDKIIDNPSNLFAILDSSDIAWAILIYVNNKEYWEAEIEKKIAKENERAPSMFSSNTRTTGRPSADTTSDPATDEDGTGNEGSGNATQKKIKQRWTMGKRNESGSDGFASNGKLFYTTIQNSLKVINDDEWKTLWTDFWKIEEEKQKTRKRKPEPEWQSIVPGDDQDECMLFDDDDEDDDIGSFLHDESAL